MCLNWKAGVNAGFWLVHWDDWQLQVQQCWTQYRWAGRRARAMVPHHLTHPHRISYTCNYNTKSSFENRSIWRRCTETEIQGIADIKRASNKELALITARKRNLRRLCFYTCLSVILFTGGSTWAGTPPPRQAHPLAVHPPMGRYTPLGSYTPREATPPGSYTPRQVPPRSVCWDMVNMRAVRILLECILVSELKLYHENQLFLTENSCLATLCLQPLRQHWNLPMVEIHSLFCVNYKITFIFHFNSMAWVANRVTLVLPDTEQDL